jgi:hypothetical protein
LINRKQLQRELDQEALTQSKEERAMNQEDMRFAAEQRAEKLAANAQTPEGRKQAAREQRKARLEEIAWKAYQKSVAEGDPAVAKQTYDDSIAQIDELYPDAGTPATQSTVTNADRAAAGAFPFLPDEQPANTPPAGEPPVLTPEQYATAPIGTRFKGIDGQIRVKKQ